MTTLILEYWYIIWGCLATIGFIAYRMHKRGGDESRSQRIRYAVTPRADPRSTLPPPFSVFGLKAIFIGMLAIPVMLIVVAYLSD